MNCVECARPMRAGRRPPDGVTIQYGARGKCGTCYARELRRTNGVPAFQPRTGTCRTCGRPLRRWSQRPSDAPGTVAHGGRGECGRCYKRTMGADLLLRVGLTVGGWHRMLIAQSGRCEVCGDPMRSPHVDHSRHVTGRVRALLCPGCNTAEGLLRCEARRARALADYIERQAFIDREGIAA